MRTTKFICLVLSLVMVFSCFTTVFADSFSDTQNSKYKEAIETICGLGVVDGYPNGTFGATNTLTRAEFAKIIVKALDCDYELGQIATTFKDVPASHWASGYIATATSMGIIQGYGDGNFGPDDAVTYAQAVTMVIRALGYDSEYFNVYQKNATWPLTYIVMGAKLGLFDEITCKDPNAAITRGEMAQMVYNALDEDIVDYNFFGVNNGVKGDTMLARLDVKSVEGVITYSDNTLVNFVDEVGKYGYTYTNKAGKVIAVVPTSDELTGEFKSGKFVVDGVKYTVTGTTAAAFVNAEKVADKAFTSYTGTVTLNCEYTGTTITKVYSVEQWVGIDKQLTKTTLFNEKKFTLAGYTFDNDGTTIDKFSYVLNGADTLSDLVNSEMVTVYLYGGTGKIVRVDVCDDVVSGTVTKISAYPIMYYIDGVAYKSNVALELGFEYKCYLNTDGVIAKATVIKGINYNTTHYAVINDYGVTLNAKSAPVNYFNGYVDGYATTMQMTTSTDLAIPTAAGLYRVTYTDAYISTFAAITPTAITCSAVYTNLIKSDAAEWYVISDDVIVYQEIATGYTLGIIEEGDKLYLYDTSVTADNVYDVIIIAK